MSIMKIYESPYEPIDVSKAARNVGAFLREGWKRYSDNTFVSATHDRWFNVDKTDAGSGLQYTGEQCAVLSEQLSVQLRARGLEKGDVVCLCTTNSVRIPVFLSAVWALNAIAATLDYGFKEDEYIEIATPYKPKMLVCNRSNLEVARKVKAGLPSIQLIITLDDDSSNLIKDIVPLGALAVDVPSTSFIKLDERPDLVAFMPRTSGTSGRSKAVLHSHRTLISAILLQGAPDVMSWPVGSAVLSSSGLLHVYSLFDTYGPCVYRGFKFVHAQSTDPPVTVSLIERYQIHTLMTTPYIILAVLDLFKTNDPLVKKTDLSSLRVIVTGSNIFPQESIGYLRKCLPSLCGFGQCYGQTELIAAFGHCYWGFYKAGTIGRILSTGRFRVVSVDSLEDVKDEKQRGELWVQLPTMTIGYHQNEKALQDATTDGWYRTGDICTVDSEGFVTIVDRLKEFIKTKHMTVSPGEVEAKLLQHPKVRDAAVIGLPHPIMQNVLHAIIVPNSRLTAEEIHAHMAEYAPEIYKLEGGMTFCDAIPRSPMGKLVRRTLIQWALNRQTDIGQS